MTTTSSKADALFAAYQADKAARPVPSDDRTADELLEQIASVIENRREHDFSVAWGRNGSASQMFRPYRDNAEAKSYRDDLATVLRRAGYKIRCSTLRAQRREWWDWCVPCGITCNVYRVEVIGNPASQPIAA